MAEPRYAEGAAAGSDTAREVQYELTECDALYAYRAGLAGRGPAPWARVAFLLLLVGLLGAVGGPVPAIGVSLGLLGLFLVALPWTVRRQARRNPAFRGPHRLQVTPEGLSGGCESVGTFQLKWSNIREVWGTPSHILMQGQGYSIMAIPRAAFRTEAEAEEFLQAAGGWHRSAAATPAAGGS